jgi:hypothetical protein
VNKLESLAAEVILEVPRPLLSLARSLEGNFRLLTKGDNPPAFDLHCPLMSLPLACDTRLDTIPADLPYLYANPDLQQHWQQQLGPNSKKRIGLVWSGSPSHKNDHRRSIPLCMFSKLFTLPLEFHCLQTEIRPADLAWLADYPAIHLHQAQLHDFADTAALIANLDLVISIDTSVAHLAGALGKPTWILLPYVPDFRWLTDRSDSPWYPTAHLWRQTAPGDWQQVIATIHASLADQLSTELFSTTSQTRITA